ncbi:Xanthan lyase precursor [Stieleria maiorica]|uniref:Xanthan lyase n=1 Tax=Stieleria maiorica TaxID=2795974 RepID=A0A5B9M9S4_9BACT|nr:FAD-dependent oxidoreductase [Stieleria maiorica]QEF96976.1 Xanthan lyase precursor [Stieleria maiorica]
MKTKYFLSWLILAVTFTPATADETTNADVVIYGGTSAAVTAAVQVKQMGKSVVIVCPDKHLGGLSSGGLGWTDTGKKEVIGGLARDFYHRIYLEYQKPESWQWQTRDSYGNKGQGNRAIDGENRTQWIFEPHVAEKVFEDYIAEYAIPVHRDRWLDRQSGVEVVDGRIVSIRMLGGQTYQAKVFLDATYEGDLLAAAGVPYHVGRESVEQYGENWNGVQTGVLHHQHHFGNLPPISPYKTPGDPSSGVLPRISADPPGEKGAADHRVQAYCFRMCLTDHPENRVPFAEPEGYDPSQYELLARIYQAGWQDTFRKFDPIPNRKTDTNNHGPMSTDNIGFNYDYPEASYERRREIIREHETYQKGWLYFHTTDPRVPDEIRTAMQSWGLAADEFTDNGNWPHQIYVREARRMIGKYVMTENELQKRRPTPKSVGMGSYSIDSHNVQRYITPEGYVQNEGDIGVSTGGPYQISYDSLVPKQSDCTNLLVPVCVSSSHIAFGSIRMEPVFMILGQSAATAAVLAIDGGSAVQDVRYEDLKERLEADGQVLQYEGGGGSGAALRPGDFSGIVLDNVAAKLDGSWQSSQANHPHFLAGYLHDGNANKGQSTATFEVALDAGTYDVQIAYPVNNNRASNVPVQIAHAEGTESVTLNQRSKPAVEDTFASLGRYRFDAGTPARVVITNDATDGYVIIDAVRFVPVKGSE